MKKFRMDLHDRQVIQELLDHGTMIKDIAQILERSAVAVGIEIRKNGGIRSYNAELAQERSDAIRQESYKNVNSPIQHLRNRVEELERKVEILMKG
jgi:IS30 family transposase